MTSTSLTPEFARVLSSNGTFARIHKHTQLGWKHPLSSTRSPITDTALRNESAASSAKNQLSRFSKPKASTVLPATNLNINTPKRFLRGKLNAGKAQHETGSLLNRTHGKTAFKSSVAGAAQDLKSLRHGLMLNMMINVKFFRDGGFQDNKFRAIGVVAPDGTHIQQHNDCMPGVFDEPEQIAQVRKTMFPRSPLHKMERMMSDEEMDVEFALLPGEDIKSDAEFCGGMNWMAYHYAKQQQYKVQDWMSVLEQFGYSQYDIEGIWRRTQGPRASEELMFVANWGNQQQFDARRAQAGAMMDVRCRRIVQGVWGFVVNT